MKLRELNLNYNRYKLQNNTQNRTNSLKPNEITGDKFRLSAKKKISFGQNFKPIEIIKCFYNLDYKDLAKLLEISPSHLCKMKNGKREFRLKHLKMLNEKLNININWFITGKGKMFLSKSKSANLKFPKK